MNLESILNKLQTAVSFTEVAITKREVRHSSLLDVRDILCEALELFPLDGQKRVAMTKDDLAKIMAFTFKASCINDLRKKLDEIFSEETE